MPLPFLAIGLGLMAGGSILKAGAGIASSRAQQRQQDVRFQQMELDARQQNRAQIRASLQARSLALTNATNQGAQYGSGLQGGFGQIAGQARRNQNYLGQSLEYGRQIFDEDARISRAGAVAGVGQGLSSLGGTMIGNLDVLNRVGAYRGWGGS